MIAATAGTTNAGMIDPLAACAEIAAALRPLVPRRCRLGRRADRFATGSRRASPASSAPNSVTIDAHKWFATTMGCGMFLTRARRASCRRPSRSRPTTCRRNIAGRRPVRQLGAMVAAISRAAPVPVAGSGRLGRLCARMSSTRSSWRRCSRPSSRARGWTIANDSPVAVVCVEPPPGSADIRTIVQRVARLGARLGVGRRRSRPARSSAPASRMARRRRKMSRHWSKRWKRRGPRLATRSRSAPAHPRREIGR